MSDTPEATPASEEVTEEASVDVAPETASNEALTTRAEDQTETPEQTFTITQNGEEVEVTLDELRNGYLRQSDYTRKTQEVAELQKFNEAYQNDPVGTARALAEANGLTLAQAQALADANATEFEDPYEQQLQEIRSEIEQQKLAAQEARFLAEASQAAKEWKLDVDGETLFRFAADQMIGDFNVAAELLATRQQQQAQQHNTAKIIEKKRADSVVSGGSTTQSGTVDTDFSDPKLKFGDIFQAIASRGG